MGSLAIMSTTSSCASGLRSSASAPTLEHTERRVLSPGNHMNRMRLVANRPMNVQMNAEFNRYYLQEEWQFPQSKLVGKSDYQHACEFLRKRWHKDRNMPKVNMVPYDQRASKNVSTLFGHPYAHKCESLYIDSFFSDSNHRKALHKARRQCQVTGLSTTDVTQMAEQEGLMKNLIRK